MSDLYLMPTTGDGRLCGGRHRLFALEHQLTLGRVHLDRVTGHEPTLQDGQVVTFDTRAYRDHAPRRGDIVLFAPPGEKARLFITRVIAIPGDRVRITNGVLAINGQTVSEPYVSEKWAYSNTWPVAGTSLVLQPNDYFVMGDNRDHSMDSRSLGFIGREAILGKLLR